jgi:hypothetical protein
MGETVVMAEMVVSVVSAPPDTTGGTNAHGGHTVTDNGHTGAMALAVVIAAAIGGGCYWNGKKKERTAQLINVQAAVPATRVAGAQLPIGGGPFMLQEAVTPMPHQQAQALEKSAAP